MTGPDRRVPGKRILQAAVVVLLAVLCIVLAGTLTARTRAADRSADRAAGSYSPPTIGTTETPLVSVVSDETSGPEPGSAAAKRAPRSWIAIAPSNVSIRLAPFIVVRSGYTKTGPSISNGGSNFVTRAAEVSASSRVVVFMGGAADRTEDPLVTIKAATRAFAAAKANAPKANLVVVGPMWPTAYPPADLLQLRNVLHTGATTVGALWIDPIDRGWLQDSTGLWTPAGVPSAAGQVELGARMTKVLQALLPST